MVVSDVRLVFSLVPRSRGGQGMASHLVAVFPGELQWSQVRGLDISLCARRFALFMAF
jgi:hypothetical protein